MPAIDIQGVIPGGYDKFTNYQLYNCLDSAITAQLVPPLRSMLNDNTRKIYNFEMELNVMCIDISSRGLPLDQFTLADMVYKLLRDAEIVRSRLDQFCEAINSPPVNPNSPVAVSTLFYKTLGLPTQYEFDRNTKQRKPSTGFKALQNLFNSYPIAKPFVSAINEYRSLKKMASVFNRGTERDDRFRCSISVTGTETGRLSSQQNIYLRGSNAQNITDEMRQVFKAPEGFAFLNLDLKTAESYAVGFIANSRPYIDACDSGDLHTAVAKMTWDNLPWTGDLKQDREIADQIFFRHFSYRDLAKRGGHLTNYYGQARSNAQTLNLTVSVMEEFQERYFTAFPEIQKWHLRTIATIQQISKLVTQVGRERTFWGRPNDPSTHRKAIAYEPQSLVGHITNAGLLAAHRWLCANNRDAKIFIRRGATVIPFNGELLMQIHDAGLFLLPLVGFTEMALKIQQFCVQPIEFHGVGTMTIPSDLSVGLRWNKLPKPGKHKRATELEGLRNFYPGIEKDL